MIFKKFLQPKWKHKDPEVRLKALESLALELDKNRETLNQLAFNDPSDKVRRSALQQLNDFDTWLKASEVEKSDWIKKAANDHIRKGLLGEADFTLDEQTKAQFIDNCNKSELLEELALKDNNEKTRLKLLLKLKKESLLGNVVQDKNSSDWLKKSILETVSDLPVLEKWLKKADESIKPVIAQKVADIKAALEKPVQLKQDVSLVLAKLNALKDKADFEEIEKRRAQLQLEWSTLKETFDVLSQQELREFNAKYDKINQSIENIIAPMKARFAAEQAKAKEAMQRKENESKVAAQLAEVESSLTNAISENDNLDMARYRQSLKDISQQLQNLNIGDEAKKRFSGQIEQFYHKVEQIPLISECMSEALRLISMLSNMKVPSNSEELQQVYDSYLDFKKQWRANERKVGLAFPQTIRTAYEELHSRWEQAIEPLKKEQEQLLGQTRKGLSDLKFLLSSGKYRRAFGLFNKVSAGFALLTESQQKMVARTYEQVQQKIEELADLQSYIAEPRKQELLEQITALADKPLDDPKAQADKVKFIRKTWNSLGRGQDEKSQAMNEQFNQVCERAFEVCRQFYAEQEAQRQANLATKETICQQLADLGELLNGESVPWQDIESGLSKVRKQWQEAGDVDREKVAEINNRYFELLDPLQKALKGHHQQNAEQKQQLLDQAQGLLEADDVFEAANELKALQQSWKRIGFAGAKVDGAIWRKFRQVNDQIFARRDAIKNERNEQNQERFLQLQQQLSAVEDIVLNGEDLAELQQQQAALRAIEDEIAKEPKPLAAKLGPVAGKLNGLINTRKKELQLAADRENYVALFAQLEQFGKTGEIDPEIESQPQWNDLISKAPQQGDSHLRYDLTIQLEIVHGAESPVRDTDRRMALQMALLSDKLNAGEIAGHQALLKDWIKVGRLAADEQELLERVKALYL